MLWCHRIAVPESRPSGENDAAFMNSGSGPRSVCIPGALTAGRQGGKTRAILLKPKTWNALLALRGEAGPVDPVFRSRKAATSMSRRVGASSMRRRNVARDASVSTTGRYLHARPTESSRCTCRSSDTRDRARARTRGWRSPEELQGPGSYTERDVRAPTSR
jgi:hypothetical protein